MRHSKCILNRTASQKMQNTGLSANSASKMCALNEPFYDIRRGIFISGKQ